MRQRAKVVEVKGSVAVVEVMRSTMCEGCENSAGCGGHCAITGIVGDSRPMKAKADNAVGALTGEIVEVESEGREILGAAALVFLAPLLVCGLFYFAGSRIFGSQGAGTVSAAAGFVLSFVFIGIFDRRMAARSPRIRIVARLNGDRKTAPDEAE